MGNLGVRIFYSHERLIAANHCVGSYRYDSETGVV